MRKPFLAFMRPHVVVRIYVLIQMKTTLSAVLGVQSAPDAKGRIQPWQRGLIPLHLFAEAVEIPELRTDGRPVTIKAQMPTFFRETLESCRLRYKEGGKSYSSNRLSRVLSK